MKVKVLIFLTMFVPAITTAQVHEEWVAWYNGPGNNWDGAADMAMDTLGNVYVTGSSWGGSATKGDYATIKYNQQGLQEWVVRYNGTGDWYDGARAIVVDAVGNIYVTGTGCELGTGDDFATIKYNPDGLQQWVAYYNGPDDYFDEVKALAVDALGNVYVTGSSFNSDSTDDYATVKYNPLGLQEWVARYDGPGNYFDEAGALAVDALGNVYVTGSSSDSAFKSDYATIKYNPQGLQQWVARYNGPGNADDWGHALALDAAGNVYVTGSSENSDSNFDYATIKYNPQGEEVWVAGYNGPANGVDLATDLAMDALGNVYVTGWSEYRVNDYEYYRTGTTVKYNQQGQEEWVAGYDDPAFDHDEPVSVALDALGNVYITGSSSNSDSVSDYATVMYNPQGVLQWAVRYNGPGDNRDGASTLAVDASGNVYVTGYSWGLTSNTDYCTIKYSQGPGVEERKSELQPLTLEVSGSEVRFSLPKAANVRLDLYDVAGSKVSQIASGVWAAGTHRAVIDSRSLASGVYFARLSDEGQTLTARVLIIR